MKYKTGASFRQALEDRLRLQSLETGIPIARRRKMVAFDRLLARLVERDPTLWIFKGGLALQWRIGDRARTTNDIDASLGKEMERHSIERVLRSAAALGLGDWFEFEAGAPSAVVTGAPLGGARFPLRCLLDGRLFERFHVDVGQGDPVARPPDAITGPPLLEFAEILPPTVPCYPLDAQIAEKLHAYSRPYQTGESSRVKDLVDILLIASFARLDGRELSDAVRATFDARVTHAVPAEMPRPPRDWSGPYRKLAQELGFRWATLRDATHAATEFLGPVLEQTAAGKWAPESWAWR